MNISVNPASLITGIFDSGPAASAKKAPFELRAGPFLGYELEVISFTGREHVNDVYEYEVTFATQVSPEHVHATLLGSPACLTVKSPGSAPQVIQGIVASLEGLGGVAGERGAHYHRYCLTIVPRLWLLKRRRVNRIFQGKTVMQIVETLLGVTGMRHEETRWRTVDKEHPPLAFVYQRSETDFELLRRVLASAGIVFYFEHATSLPGAMMASASVGVEGVSVTASVQEGLSAATGHGVTVLNFVRRASDTPALAGGSAISAGAALGIDLGGVSVSASVGVHGGGGTLRFDDGMGAGSGVERVYEFGLKKRMRAQTLQLLERRVAESSNWIGIARPQVARAALFEIDTTQIEAKALHAERYQIDPTLTQTTADPKGIDGIQRQLELELARTRRRYVEARGKSDCRRIASGYRFTLAAHPITALNGEYLVTAVRAEGHNPDFVKDADFVYRSSFRCIPSAYLPLPPRPKKRPKLGLEVAQVVAYSEIAKVPWLESSPCGYVKVRFRWDVLDKQGTPAAELKVGTEDDRAIWVPVLQPWAGAGYGAQFIPREGMEVLVGFLEDQGERPVILGCLYSAGNAPPWGDKAGLQKVGIKSQTRPADKGYSEISIDDTQGKEVVTLRAQLDLGETVLHDRTTTIGNDRTEGVGNNLSISVANDSTLKVGGNQAIHVKGDRQDSVGGKVDFSAGDALSDAVAKDRLETTGGDHTSTIAGSRNSTIKGSIALTVEGDGAENFGGNHTLHIDGTATTIVGKEEATTGYSNFYVYGDHSLGAAGNIRISALQSIVFECGATIMAITPSGVQVASQGIAMAAAKQMTLTGKSAAVTLTDTAEIAAKSVSVLSSGASLALDSDATLQGGSVHLGSGAPPAQAATDSSATLQTKSFNLTPMDPKKKPYPNKKYTLLVDGVTTSGTTDGTGAITAAIAPTATLAHLTVWTGDYPTGPRLRFEIQLAAALEPANSPRGALDRLRNIGYYSGAVGDAMTPAGTGALQQFQADQGLPVTGSLDAATIAALSTAHGH